MKLINKKENQITFKIEVEKGMINAIRRYVNHIPIAAIEEVNISKNDSPLYDETIAHRIGLIPLKMEKIDNDKDVELKLSVKREGSVYSGDLKGGIKVVYDKIPITILNKDQEIELSAKIKIGKGVDHSKFSPGTIFYRECFEIKLNKDSPKEIVDFCPQKLFKLEGDKIIIKDEEACDFCECCIEIARKKDKEDSIKITPTTELLVTIESFGQINPEDVFKKSIDALKKDVSEISKKIEK